MGDNAPSHRQEHDELMQLIAKVAGSSQLIDAMVLITIGRDGRPCLGSDVEDPRVVLSILQQLVDAGTTNLVHVRKIEVPKDN